MTQIHDRIIEEIDSALNNNRNINQIRLDDDAYNELLDSDSLTKRRDSNAIETEVCGVDVKRDPIVDRISVDKEEQNYAYSRGKCLLCSRQMMYDEKNSEYYCPICKI